MNLARLPPAFLQSSGSWNTYNSVDPAFGSAVANQEERDPAEHVSAYAGRFLRQPKTKICDSLCIRFSIKKISTLS
jgi:hypothetical protein